MKNLYNNFFCSVLLLFSISLQGQNFEIFDEHVIEDCEYCSITELITGDIDQDGDKDLITASTHTNEIFLFKNEGFGEFSTPTLISDELNFITYINLSDLNNDGFPDLVITHELGKSISWLANDTEGNFLESRTITFAEYRRVSININDIDSDGDLDILVGIGVFLESSESNRLVLFENDGLGNFAPEQVIDIYENVFPASVFISDLNGDGKNDLLINQADLNEDWLIMYINKDNLEFSEPIEIDYFPIVEVSRNNTNLYAVDLDNDGDKDIIASFGLFTWYENDGMGNFKRKPFNRHLVRLHNFIPVDIDNDGDFDLISISGSISGNLRFYENAGDGQFLPPKMISDKIFFIYFSVDDLDEDGVKEILALSSGFRENKISKFVIKENGEFSEDQPIYKDNHLYLNTVLNFDIDSDGDEDLISASIFDSKIALYENLEAGVFSSQKIVSEGTGNLSKIELADLDNDGDEDIIAGYYKSGDLVWFENIGQCNFENPKIISTTSLGINNIIKLDLDNDGDLDIIIATDSDKKRGIFWYENFGQNQFSEERLIFNNFDGVRFIQLADIDMDGHQDIVGNFPIIDEDSIYRTDDILWFPNNGDGSFSNERLIFTSSDFVRSIELGDIDNDGDLDLIPVNRREADFVWYINNGRGDFARSPNNILSPGIKVNWANQVKLVDMDYDSQLDLVMAASFYSDLYPGDVLLWKKNNGCGGFGYERIISSNKHPLHGLLSVSDLDNDNDKDVIFAGYNKITWFESLNPIRTEIPELSEFTVITNPNPFSSEIIIEIEDWSFDMIPIFLLFDNEGKLKMQSIIPRSPFRIETSSLLSGMYFYKVVDKMGGIIGSGKLIKK